MAWRWRPQDVRLAPVQLPELRAQGEEPKGRGLYLQGARV